MCVTGEIKYLKLIGLFTYSITETNRSITGWSDNRWQEFNSTAPIDSPLLKKIPTLKDNLKEVAQTLSKRFENDKDYPEWQKWVNKIFPKENTPESQEMK